MTVVFSSETQETDVLKNGLKEEHDDPQGNWRWKGVGRIGSIVGVNRLHRWASLKVAGEGFGTFEHISKMSDAKDGKNRWTWKSRLSDSRVLRSINVPSGQLNISSEFTVAVRRRERWNERQGPRIRQPVDSFVPDYTRNYNCSRVVRMGGLKGCIRMKDHLIRSSRPGSDANE